MESADDGSSEVSIGCVSSLEIEMDESLLGATDAGAAALLLLLLLSEFGEETANVGLDFGRNGLSARLKGGIIDLGLGC